MAITEYGAVITIAEKDVLDSFNASWTRRSSRTAGPNLDFYKSYAMDDVDPLAFWLYPRPVAAANVIVTYAGIPAAIATTADVLTINDMYVPQLVDYVAARALGKESRAGAGQVAAAWYNRFLMALGGGRQVLRDVGQNAHRPPDAQA